MSALRPDQPVLDDDRVSESVWKGLSPRVRLAIWIGAVIVLIGAGLLVTELVRYEDALETVSLLTRNREAPTALHSDCRYKLLAREMNLVPG